MIDSIRQKLKHLALADAILMPDWQYRYFSYNSNWSQSEEMASLRDGSGGEWFLWLSHDLAGYKCFSPEDGRMSGIAELKAAFPIEYHRFINEPAFSIESSTCIWYLHNSKWIKYGHKVKWLIDLPKAVSWKASDYQMWAEEYYERKIDLKSLEKLFAGEFTEKIVRQLNSEVSILDLESDIKEIGFFS